MLNLSIFVKKVLFYLFYNNIFLLKVVLTSLFSIYTYRNTFYISTLKKLFFNIFTEQQQIPKVKEPISDKVTILLILFYLFIIF